MPLFQKNVLKDYLKNQDQQAVEQAYENFSAYFHDAGIQKNIRNSNEEQFQATFLTKLFVDSLGYTLFPDRDHNLTTEHRNEVGAKKADGAILAPTTGGQKAVAVIELKSTKTKDLDSIRKQAFDYKANHTECRYVITSNFEKLRFYVSDAVEWLEFDLFRVTKDDFAVLHLCLQKDNLLNDLPQKIKNDSLLQEEKVTKNLYKDYSLFRMELFRDLVNCNRRNPELKEHSEKSVKFTLFKKTQKLLDRFLFIFFAEDRGLIPRNMIKQVNNEWKDLQKMRGTQSLYDRYKLYFSDLNNGNRDQDIFAYNGGLFEPDPILDHVEVDDELLFKHTEKLTNYDFESEVDVNILGHIFEHSLNEIESVNAEIEGVDFDKQKARRKKDGVFYTPKYITKYIVDNTIGKLCDEKKKELEITAEVYEGAAKRHRKRIDNLQQYRDWLLGLKICDPACGSGAFLNQALEFLIAEHRHLDELSAAYHKESLVLSEVENSILENNLYGVDINQESVDIAKLSLWLRTAQRGRKLTSLSNNIKCGNSLIDSKAVAGDKAFRWDKEFPEVFSQGGFDVVIGNPPYLGGRDWKNNQEGHYEYFIKNYEVAEYQFDMYVVFWEKGIKLLRKNGLIGFITPNTWLNNLKTQKLRSFVLTNTSVLEVYDYSEENVFEDAVVLPVIFILRNGSQKLKTKVFKPLENGKDLFYSHEISSDYWMSSDNQLININIGEDDRKLVQKIEQESKELEELATVKFGIKLYEKGKGNPTQESYFSKNNIYESNYQIDESYRKYLEGKDANPYLISWKNRWLKYGENLAAPRDKRLFEGERILVRRITGDRLICAFTDEDYVTSQLLQIVKPHEPSDAKWLIGILNSSLIAYFFKKKFNRLDKSFPEIRIYELRSLPIKPPSNEKKNPLIEAVDEVLAKNYRYNTKHVEFTELLEAKYNLSSKKLDRWDELSSNIFLNELKKSAGNLSLTEESDWITHFKKNKQELNRIKLEVDSLIADIDNIVYEIYSLSENEKKTVEKFIKHS